MLPYRRSFQEVGTSGGFFSSGARLGCTATAQAGQSPQPPSTRTCKASPGARRGAGGCWQGVFEDGRNRPDQSSVRGVVLGHGACLAVAGQAGQCSRGRAAVAGG